LRERDSKYKVMEARRQNTEREEWHGIKEQEDDDGSSVGGWDERDRSELSSDESESSDELETSVAGGRKRPHTEEATSHSAKRARLVTKLEEPKLPFSKAAQVWFSQDVFAGMDRADVISENEDEGEGGLEDSDDEDMSVDEHSVRPTHCLCL